MAWWAEKFPLGARLRGAVLAGWAVTDGDVWGQVDQYGRIPAVVCRGGGAFVNLIEAEPFRNLTQINALRDRLRGIARTARVEHRAPRFGARLSPPRFLLAVEIARRLNLREAVENHFEHAC